jgi:hypothetical protein
MRYFPSSVYALRNFVVSLLNFSSRFTGFRNFVPQLRSSDFGFRFAEFRHFVPQLLSYSFQIEAKQQVMIPKVELAIGNDRVGPDPFIL